MIRVVDALLVAAAIAGAVWTYQIKHEAELSAKRIKTLKSQIQAQNRKIDLLQADWAIETSPARLEMLSNRFETQLGLRAMESSQIATIDELPDIRETPLPEEIETLAETNDGTLTGSITDLIEREETD